MYSMITPAPSHNHAWELLDNDICVRVTPGNAVNEAVCKMKKVRGPPVAAPAHAWNGH